MTPDFSTPYRTLLEISIANQKNERFLELLPLYLEEIQVTLDENSKTARAIRNGSNLGEIADAAREDGMLEISGILRFGVWVK